MLYLHLYPGATVFLGMFHSLIKNRRITLCKTLIHESIYAMEIPWNAVFRRFIIRGIPSDLEDNYIFNELKEHNKNIIFEEIYRFKRKVYEDDNVILQPTSSIKITIRGQTIPEHINLWGLKVNTSVFIPSIRQCFRCGQLSHSTKFCQNKEKCIRCGQDKDSSHETCTQEPRCVNCNGNHASLDRMCPEVILRKEITSLMATKNMDFNEARKLLRPEPPPRKDILNFPLLPTHHVYCYHSNTSSSSCDSVWNQNFSNSINSSRKSILSKAPKLDTKNNNVTFINNSETSLKVSYDASDHNSASGSDFNTSSNVYHSFDADFKITLINMFNTLIQHIDTLNNKFLGQDSFLLVDKIPNSTMELSEC